jgi:gluconokinase
MMGSNQTAAPRVVIVMGVAGSGKTVVGSRLAARLGGRFFDADEFHPPENIVKMAAGVPLSDDDRQPWFAGMRREVVEAAPPGTTWVLACSALKKSYRDFLRHPDETDVRFVFLDGDYDLIFARMAQRKDHFMREGMLRSQFETLERPDAWEAMTVGVDQSPDAIVAEIISRL